MVGTVEPRKGHDQVLDAFERMWAVDRPPGSPWSVVAGGWSTGWLSGCPGLDRSEPRFRWLESAGDAELDELYGCCTAVVMASWAEGFGLPVVEASLRGCPVVIRDIPVLREVGGDAATYVRADGSDFAEILSGVLDRASRGPLPVRPVEHVRTWREVAQDLVALLADPVGAGNVWFPEDRRWRRA